MNLVKGVTKMGRGSVGQRSQHFHNSRSLLLGYKSDFRFRIPSLRYGVSKQMVEQLHACMHFQLFAYVSQTGKKIVHIVTYIREHSYICPDKVNKNFK